jgi:hypothetical protein
MKLYEIFLFIQAKQKLFIKINWVKKFNFIFNWTWFYIQCEHVEFYPGPKDFIGMSRDQDPPQEGSKSKLTDSQTGSN